MKKKVDTVDEMWMGEGLRGARGAGVGGMAAARRGCSRVLCIITEDGDATPNLTLET